jgi:hypothetical protein
LNSSIPLKFYDLINLSAYSITGLTIIGAALTAFFLLGECISRISYRILEYDGRYTWIIVLLLLFYAGWLYAGTDRNPLLALLLAMVFLLLNLKHSFSFSAFLKSARVFLMLLVLALTGTLLLNTISGLRNMNNGQSWLATSLMPGINWPSLIINRQHQVFNRIHC